MNSDCEQRKKVISQAENKGIAVPENYLTDSIRMPEPFQLKETDLGGMTARFLHVPGHTPGSLVVYVPEYRLLLSGDDWNPCTWLWFPSSVSIREWKTNMEKLVMTLPFTGVLCSHQFELQPREKMERFMNAISDESIEAAVPDQLGGEIDTRHIIVPEDMIIEFDYRKE